MAQILILLFFIMLLSMLALMIHGGEILTPSFGICAGFFISVIAAGMNYERWNLNLHWNTIGVIVSGLFVFICVDFFVAIVAAFREHRVLGRTWREVAAEKRQEIRVQPLNCEKAVILFFIAFVIFNSILYLRSVLLIVQHSGRVVNGWTETARAFRNLVSYYQGDEDVPFLIKQIHYMISYLGYVCVYLLVYQWHFFKKIDKRLCVLFMVILAHSVIDSSRLRFLYLLMMFIVCYDMFQYWRTGSGIKFKISTLIKLMGAAFLVFLVFVLLKSVVGRIDNRSPVYYITYYLGQSIHNFDDFIHSHYAKSEFWGKETFHDFYHALYILTKNPKFNYMIHKEFLFENGESLGNIYTVFRAYIRDFGYPGMYILTACSSLIMNLLYYSSRSAIWNGRQIGYCGRLLFYAYLYLGVFFSFYADYFYNSLISFQTLKVLLGFWFWELALVRVKFNVKKENLRYGSRLVGYRPGL